MNATKLLRFVKPAGLYSPGDVAGFEGERGLREAATYVANGAAIVVTRDADGILAPAYDGPDRRAPRRRWTDHVGPAVAEPSAPAPLPRARAENEELVTVEFTRAAELYGAGERASFRRARAEALIAEGAAVAVPS